MEHAIEQEEVIRKIEKQVDTYFENLEYFKSDKTTLLIDTVNCLQFYNYKFKMEEGNNLLSFMLHLKRAINVFNKMIEGILSFSKNNSCEDVTISGLFDECEKYSFVCDAFTAYSRGLYDAIFDEAENKIIFSFKKPTPFSTRIFINDELERMYDKAIAVSNGIKMAEKEIRGIYPIGSPILKLNEETAQYVNTLMDPLYDSAVNRHFNSQTQVPTEWDLIGITMDEFRIGWCALTKIALKKISEDYQNIFLGKEFDAYLCFKVKEIIKIIQDNVLTREKAELILNLLIYNPKLKNNSILYQPIFFIGEDEVIFAPSLFVEFIPQDNFIAIVNKVNNKLYTEYSIQKEVFLIEELNNLLMIDNDIFHDHNIKLPNDLPDIDYLIYDRKTNIVFVLELKFLLKANCLKEKLTRDDEIQIGINQILKYKEYVSKNINQIINDHFHIITNITEICFLVLSKNGLYSGNYNDEIPVISYDAFENLIIEHGSDYNTIINVIQERHYLPKEQVDYDAETLDFEFGKINFSIPFIRPIIYPEDNIRLLAGTEILKHSYKIKRNSPCPCGSGKKYKKCCGKEPKIL